MGWVAATILVASIALTSGTRLARRLHTPPERRRAATSRGHALWVSLPPDEQARTWHAAGSGLLGETPDECQVLAWIQRELFHARRDAHWWWVVPLVGEVLYVRDARYLRYRRRNLRRARAIERTR